MQKYFDDVCVLDSAGDVVPLLGATITVYDQGTTNLSTIYSDNGITPKSNPFTAEDDGSFEFYAADGRYDILATKSPYKPQKVEDVILLDVSLDLYVSRNKQTFDVDYTLTGDYNGSCVGPITIADGKTLTIEDDAILVVI